MNSSFSTAQHCSVATHAKKCQFFVIRPESSETCLGRRRNSYRMLLNIPNSDNNHAFCSSGGSCTSPTQERCRQPTLVSVTHSKTCRSSRPARFPEDWH